MNHLYAIETTDGRTLEQWADSPWQAMALVGVLPAEVVNITMLA